MDVTERVEAQQTIAKQKAIIEDEVQRRTADLNAALERQKLLMHEVDHRVKNNLSMIGSLLRLQARKVADPIFSERLNSMLERVDALAAVHRQLYQTDKLGSFDVGIFSETLMRDVVGSSGRDDIELLFDCQSIPVPASRATPLGLILNEIFTNSMKHAYGDGRSGRLVVTASESDGRAAIKIEDDGPGRKVDKAAQGFGETLIKRLAKQIRAEIEWQELTPGTCVVVRFPTEAMS
jgi:two-component sensor histidine kinase